MKTIHKYPVTLPDEGHTITIPMHEGAEILHVDRQAIYGDRAWLWALVDTEKPMVSYFFELYGTGHDVHLWSGPEHVATSFKRLKHIGTFMFDAGGFVGHLFQVMNPFGNPEVK